MENGLNLLTAEALQSSALGLRTASSVPDVSSSPDET